MIFMETIDKVKSASLVIGMAETLAPVSSSIHPVIDARLKQKAAREYTTMSMILRKYIHDAALKEFPELEAELHNTKPKQDDN